MSKAYIFPGQGSQFVGMGKDLYDNFESAKQVFDKADKVLGRSISQLCFEGPEESLKQTINTQPAIVTMSIAVLETLKSKLDMHPDYTAGHSLGEYCAMYTSGVMSLENTLRAIQKRAELMSQTSTSPMGAMCAILNPPSKEVIAKCLDEASDFGYVEIANYNSPSQIVLTGWHDAVERAGTIMCNNGAKRAVLLPVSGAFHSKMMQDAGEKFAKFIADFRLNNANIPVITNVDAQATIAAEDFRLKMSKQIYSSVHWTQTIQKMAENGVDTFIEIGPGKVLAGLNKKIVPDANVYNIFDKESLENTINELKENLVEI